MKRILLSLVMALVMVVGLSSVAMADDGWTFEGQSCESHRACEREGGGITVRVYKRSYYKDGQLIKETREEFGGCCYIPDSGDIATCSATDLE